MTFQITLNIPAIEVSIGGQTATGAATIVLPVETAQLITMLQSMDGAPAPAPLPPQAAPIVVQQQPVLTAPVTTAEPVPIPAPTVPAAEVVEPAPLPSVEIKSRRPGKLKNMSDDDLLQAFSEAGNGARAARALGVTPAAIYQHAKRLGFVFSGNTKGGAGTTASPTFPGLDG